MNFKEAWDFLNEHQIFMNEYAFSHFQQDLHVDVVLVNPTTNCIDDDESKNSKIQVWLEHGIYEKEYRRCSHDIDLDCGADTYEEAIVQLAGLVKDKYGMVIDDDTCSIDARIEQLKNNN